MWPIPAELPAGSPGQSIIRLATTYGEESSWTTKCCGSRTAAPGDVLVGDNGGILDEACVGDLVALEAHAAGREGMVIWGLHRDTADIRAIGLPVFSLGAIPTGPLRLDARPVRGITVHCRTG